MGIIFSKPRRTLLSRLLAIALVLTPNASNATFGTQSSVNESNGMESLRRLNRLNEEYKKNRRRMKTGTTTVGDAISSDGRMMIEGKLKSGKEFSLVIVFGRIVPSASGGGMITYQSYVGGIHEGVISAKPSEDGSGNWEVHARAGLNSTQDVVILKSTPVTFTTF